MTLNAEEKSLIKKFIDDELPAIVAAEENRLPVFYKGLVTMVMSALMPAIVAAIDAKLADAPAGV